MVYGIFALIILGLYHWSMPDGQGAWEQWSFRQVITQEFRAANIGESFGPLWSTHWFRVSVISFHVCFFSS